MKMGFTNIDKKETYNRIFLDREDIFMNIENNVRIYNERDDFFKLFTFYGMGGIGKSQLLKKINDLYTGTKETVYYFPLEILNHETIPSILLCIRRKFEYIPHFDYALFRYWDFISCERIDRETMYSISKKLFKRIGKIFDATLGQGILDTEQLVRDILNIYEQKEISNTEKLKVSELLQDKIEDLYIYLANTLACDIQKEVKYTKYMFFFDAYDLGKSNYKFDWLKHFINAFETGIFFVTSREPLNWFDNNTDQSVIENRSLDTIPKEEIEKYLFNQGYTKDQIDFIIKKTDCIPLYLDLALAMDRKTLFTTNRIIGFDHKEDLVKHLLSHLNRDEQMIIEYLSITNLFNEEIYNNAVKFNKLSLLNYPFSDFKRSTIVRYVEEFNNLYKIHTVLANNISLFIETKIRERVICDYLNVIHSRIIYQIDLTDDVKYNLIINVYHLIEINNLYISEEQSEKLLDLFFYLADRSYGNDFYKYINSIKKRKNSNLIYIYKYIIGKAARSINIISGLNELNSIPLEQCKFGKHKKSLICDINYLLSISGNYYEAERRMRVFAAALTDDERNERYYIKGILYNCDMQMLRGKFKSAVMGLELLSNNVSDQKFLYEIHKAIGHCYRFNFLYESAMKHYSEVTLYPYNISYYLTVCCETYCYYVPQKVLDIYPKALEENERYNNHNNIGKIYYSVAISSLLLNNIYHAKKFVQKAYAEFNRTKYHAGTFFTMITEAYIEYSQNRKISVEIFTKIKKQLNKIDSIYEYLLLPIYVLKENHKKIEEIKERYEWFSFKETLFNIEEFIKLL